MPLALPEQDADIPTGYMDQVHVENDDPFLGDVPSIHAKTQTGSSQVPPLPSIARTRSLNDIANDTNTVILSKLPKMKPVDKLGNSLEDIPVDSWFLPYIFAGTTMKIEDEMKKICGEGTNGIPTNALKSSVTSPALSQHISLPIEAQGTSLLRRMMRGTSDPIGTMPPHSSCKIDDPGASTISVDREAYRQPGLTLEDGMFRSHSLSPEDTHYAMPSSNSLQSLVSEDSAGGHISRSPLSMTELPLKPLGFHLLCKELPGNIDTETDPSAATSSTDIINSKTRAIDRHESHQRSQLSAPQIMSASYTPSSMLKSTSLHDAPTLSLSQSTHLSPPSGLLFMSQKSSLSSKLPLSPLDVRSKSEHHRSPQKDSFPSPRRGKLNPVGGGHSAHRKEGLQSLTRVRTPWVARRLALLDNYLLEFPCESAVVVGYAQLNRADIMPIHHGGDYSVRVSYLLSANLTAPRAAFHIKCESEEEARRMAEDLAAIARLTVNDVYNWADGVESHLSIGECVNVCL